MSTIVSALEQEINEVEELRLHAYKKNQEAKRMMLKTIGISVLIGVVVALVLQFTKINPVFGLIAPIVIGVVVSFFRYNSIVGDSQKIYSSAYKHKIIGGIAKHLQPEMNYEPYSGISREVFATLGHYSSPDRYNTEDLFHGMVDKTRISFAEAKAEQRRTRTDGKGRTQTYWVTLFKGIIFTADFHKHFNTWITIGPDNESDGFFGRIAQKFQSLGGNLVKLESPEFEKHFLVRCPDDIQARYILTPDIQQRLLDLRSKISMEMRITFQNSSLYITIPQSEDWFEADLKTPVRDLSLLNSVASQMQYLFQIVDIMNLNTRIWTKE